MDQSPTEHRRRSIRLKDFDYAQPGAYFVTICVRDRLCLFGTINNGQMALNAAGQTIEHWWQKLSQKYPSIELDEHVVMPNHFHGLICIQDVGATLCGRPEGRPRGAAPTLGRMVGWFKTMTTNAYLRGIRQSGWRAFEGSLWQRNYYEHIVRNERDLEQIREYIALNPANWAADRENPTAVKAKNLEPVWQV